MLDNYADILTVEETEEALRIGSNAIYKLLNSGRLRAFRNGRTWRIPKAAIEAYILEQAGLQP